MFRLEMADAPIDVCGERGPDVADFLRVEAFEPLGGDVRNLVFLPAEHLLPSRREVDDIGLQVPVPEPVIRAPHGQRVALLAFAQRGLGLATTELGLDTRHGHGEVDRLGHVVVRARIQGRDDVVTLVTRGHHDDGELRRRVRLADDLQHLETAQTGHFDVEENEHEAPRRKDLERLPAVDSDRDVVAVPLQSARQHVAVHLVVVDDEDRATLRSRCLRSLARIDVIFCSSRAKSIGLVS